MPTYREPGKLSRNGLLGSHTERCEFRQRVDQMLEGSSKTVDFPDQHSVKASTACGRDQPIECRPRFFAARHALTCELFDNLPAAAPGVLPQFGRQSVEDSR